MKTFLKKISSRKFIASAMGIFTGIGVIISGNEIEGIITVIASVCAYLIAEGYIDAKAVNVADEVIEETKELLGEGKTND